jgi:hypothetical protein
VLQTFARLFPDRLSMDILCDLTLSQELFSRVSLTTIGHLRAVCRRVLSANESAIEPYAIALAFAKTRPNIGGLSLTLSQWREIWAGCELALEPRRWRRVLGDMLLHGRTWVTSMNSMWRPQQQFWNSSLAMGKLGRRNGMNSPGGAGNWMIDCNSLHALLGFWPCMEDLF